MRTILSLLVVFTVVACGGSTVEVGGYDGEPGSGSGDGGSTLPDGSPSANGVNVEIHLRASASAVPHADGLSGQTPSDQKIGIRKLTMLTSASDPAPFVV